MFLNPRHHISRAFSLIEVLMVVAVMALLLMLVVPSTNHVLQATQLTTAAENIVATIRQTRAEALTRNQPAEVVFLKKKDASGKSAFRALAIRTLESDGTTQWVSGVQALPNALVISSSAAFSNLIGEQNLQNISDLPHVTEGIAVRIYPSGEAEAPSPKGSLKATDPLFLTVGSERALGDDENNLPDNFVTIQIDPRNGRVTSFRP